MGIVGAFSNTNRLNNFSVALVTVEKSKSWCIMNSEEKIKNIVNIINKDLSSSGKSKMIGSYLLTNVYNLDVYLNNSVDILIANLPFQNELKFGGEYIDLLDVDFEYGTTMPLYCNLISWNGKYKLTYYSRTNDINNKKLFQSQLLI